MNDIVQLIGSVGFPAVMCLLMYMQANKNTEVIRELSETIAKNTAVIQALWNKHDDLTKDG